MVLLALMVVANTSNGTTNLAWGKPKKYSHSAFTFGNRGGIPRIDGYSRGSNVVYNRHGVPSNRSPVGYGGKRGGYNYKRSPYLRSGKNSPYGVNKGFSNHGSSSGYNNIGGGRSVYPTHGTANGYSTHIRGRGYPTHGQNDVYSSQDENVGYPSHGGRNVYSTYGRANEYSTHVRGSGYPTRGGNSATPRYGGNVGYLNYDGGSGYDNYGGDNGYNKNGGYFKNGYGSGGYRICPNQTFYDDIYRWSDLADGYPRVQINQEIQGGIASANPCANIFNLANCLSRMRPDPTAPTVPTVDPMLGKVISACTKTQLTLRSYFSANPANRGQCWALAQQGLMTFVRCQNQFCKNTHYYGEFENRCITTYRRVSLWAYCENRPLNRRIVFDTILLPTCCECQSIRCHRKIH